MCVVKFKKMIIFLIFKANNAYVAYKDKHIIVNQDVTLSICICDNWMRYLGVIFKSIDL